MTASETRVTPTPSAGERITAMNPQGYPPKVEQLGMAPRPSSLQGRPVYLVDCRFDDSDLLLRQMENWFKEHMPSVETVFVSKSGVYTEDDDVLFREIRDRGGVAILGVGH